MHIQHTKHTICRSYHVNLLSWGARQCRPPFPCVWVRVNASKALSIHDLRNSISILANIEGCYSGLLRLPRSRITFIQGTILEWSSRYLVIVFPYCTSMLIFYSFCPSNPTGHQFYYFEKSWKLQTIPRVWISSDHDYLTKPSWETARHTPYMLEPSPSKYMLTPHAAEDLSCFSPNVSRSNEVNIRDFTRCICVVMDFNFCFSRDRSKCVISIRTTFTSALQIIESEITITCSTSPQKLFELRW